MLYYVPKQDRWYLLGYRVFDPDIDEKSKIDHVGDLLQEIEQNCICYVGVLMDTWYAVSSLFQLITSYGKYFYCPIKSNRLVKASDNTIYEPIIELVWTADELQKGRPIKVKNLNMNVKAFKVTVSTNRIDYVLTNDLRETTTEQISIKQKMRWHIECLHRELKQLTGIEKCQCRKALSQRTHIFCAMLVWNKIKNIAYDTFVSAYQVKAEPLRKYLVNELLGFCPTFA
jgi:Transposase DDE domain